MIGDKFQEALHFAANAHKNQKFPGTDYTYLVHISLVVNEVSNAVTNAKLNNEEIDEELAIVSALLHDVIEDTGVTYDEILNLFGSKIANGVLALTKNSCVDKKMAMVDSLSRIKKEPKEIWMVKLADRICNLTKPVSYWNNEKKKSYLSEGKMIFDELKDADKFLANRLEERIKNYSIYIE